MAKKKPDLFDTKDEGIREIRERMTYADGEWREIRQEGRTDMLCVAGKVWEALDPAGVRQREEAGRPMITADELNQYFNQAINDVRANPRAVKFTPNGNGATDKTAEFYADKMREIEYRSKAQIAYLAAFENAVQRGYGFVRVKAKWESERSPYQDLWIDALPNPDLVLLDPDAMSPDASDIKFGFIYEVWKQKEFLRKYGEKAKLTDFSTFRKDAPFWVKAQDLILAEYWKISTKPRELYLLTGGQDAVDTRFADELKKDGLPPGFQLGQKLRDVDYPYVTQCLTNGIEILEEHDWPGRSIPIASCYGKVLYVDDGGGAKRMILSMTRLVRSPYMLYCYYRTTQAELVGMTPKTPYMAYRGSLKADQLKQIQKSLHEPVAVILAEATADGVPANTILPLPERQPYSPEIERLEIGAEGARRAIQAAMATSFLPTQAQRRNEKSGTALEKMDQIAQKGSFHFNDSYDHMVARVGAINEEVMDAYYDTRRQVGIRKPNDTAEMIWINAPSGKSPDGKSPALVSTKGSHLVTVSTGPSFDSSRDQANSFADTLIGSPEVMQILGPQKAQKLLGLAVKLKTLGPIGDEMIEVIDPQPKDQGEPPDPQQLMQRMAQQEQVIGQLKQLLSQIAMDLKTKKFDLASKEKIAQLEMDSRERIAAGKDYTAVETTAMKLGSAEAIAAAEAQIAQAQAQLTSMENELARHHDVGMHAQQTDDATAEAERQRQHEGTMDELGHQQALESQQQAADLAPEPAAGA